MQVICIKFKECWHTQSRVKILTVSMNERSRAWHNVISFKPWWMRDMKINAHFTFSAVLSPIHPRDAANIRKVYPYAQKSVMGLHEFKQRCDWQIDCLATGLSMTQHFIQPQCKLSFTFSFQLCIGITGFQLESEFMQAVQWVMEDHRQL